MEVTALQHCSGITEEGMPEVDWIYLNSIVGMIFGFLRIAVTAFSFLHLLSGVFVVVEESFALELMAYNSESDRIVCSSLRGGGGELGKLKP